MSKRIIVLGILRSGTSLVADLVRHWGAYAGHADDIWRAGIEDSREYGYLEHRELQALNDDLLDHNDRVPPLPDLMQARAVDPAFRDRALQLIQKMDKEVQQHQAAAWVWKDARLPLTLPFWGELWGEVIYVVPIRHPIETILSAARSEGLEDAEVPFSAGLAYWQICMLSVLSHTQRSPRKVFIAYDQLLAEPQRECARLSDFLDIPCGLSSAGALSRIEAMVSCVDVSQQHHRYSRPLAEMAQVSREQRALYDFLRVKTLYPDEAYVADDFAPFVGWREFLECVNNLLVLSQSGGDSAATSLKGEP